MRPEDEELIERLRSLLGLNSYEARAYLTLLRLGQAQASKIADEARVPRGRIYDVLKNLESKGLVARDKDAYIARSPKSALESLAQKTLLEAQKKYNDMITLANILNNEYKITGTGHEEFRIIHGLIESLSAALSILDSCKDNVYFTVNKVLERLEEASDYLMVLIERLPPGTTIIIPPDKDPPREYLSLLEEKKILVKRSQIAFLDMMIACNNVLIGLPSTRHTAVTLHVRNNEFAQSLIKQIEELT